MLHIMCEATEQLVVGDALSIFIKTNGESMISTELNRVDDPRRALWEWDDWTGARWDREWPAGVSLVTTDVAASCVYRGRRDMLLTSWFHRLIKCQRRPRDDHTHGSCAAQWTNEWMSARPDNGCLHLSPCLSTRGQRFCPAQTDTDVISRDRPQSTPKIQVSRSARVMWPTVIIHAYGPIPPRRAACASSSTDKKAK